MSGRQPGDYYAENWRCMVPERELAIITAADRYAAAYVAHEAATTARRAAYEPWHASAALSNAHYDAAVEAQRVARREMDAALGALERAARGER